MSPPLKLEHSDLFQGLVISEGVHYTYTTLKYWMTEYMHVHAHVHVAFVRTVGITGSQQRQWTHQSEGIAREVEVFDVPKPPVLQDLWAQTHLSWTQ